MGWYSSKGKGILGVNLKHPTVTNGDGDALFPNYFGQDLFSMRCDANRDVKQLKVRPTGMIAGERRRSGLCH